MKKPVQVELIEAIIGVIDMRTDIDVWDSKFTQLHADIATEVHNAIRDLFAVSPDELQNIVNMVRRWADRQDKSANWIWDRGNQEMILHVRDPAMAKAIGALVKGWDGVTLEPAPEVEAPSDDEELKVHVIRQKKPFSAEDFKE